MQSVKDHTRVVRVIKIAIWVLLALMVIVLCRKPLLGLSPWL
ncbi:MAG: hypothetical protein SFV51_30320 [Bryobacteraceae bacterium]|nr:hypothetical protein [Bryobacteraceae bacterium]